MSSKVIQGHKDDVLFYIQKNYGEGLYAKERIPAQTVLSFYNGIKQDVNKSIRYYIF